MLFTYAPRVFRFALRGRRAYARASQSKHITERAAQLTPVDGLSAERLAVYEECFSKPIAVKMYCGFRMIDLFGHVNNATYLEMMECARWYYLSYTQLASNMKKSGMYFVVSNVSLQFVREIRPYQNVYVTCLTIPTAGPTPGSIDRKRMCILQEVYSADGKKLFASAVMHAALMGPAEYAAHLEKQYPTKPEDAAAEVAGKKSTHKNVVLDVYKALSDAVGATSDKLLLDWVINAEKTLLADKPVNSEEHTWVDRLLTANKDFRTEVRNKTMEVPKKD